MEISIHEELDHEEIGEAGAGTGTRTGYQYDFGGRERKGEDAELSEAEMREDMDEYDRAIEARA
jgi:hypothetical protein